VLSAQGVYRGLVEKANERAEEIVAEAKRRAEEITAETQRLQDEAVHRVEKLFRTMKAQHEAAIDTINAEWQDYLCGLYAERGEEPAAEEPEETPGDLEEKVGAIAQELFEINAGSALDQYEDDDDEDEDD
jgi:restriction endonuclease S subunit